jgi:hypothetical protein
MEFRHLVMLCQGRGCVALLAGTGSEAEFTAGPLGEPERRDYDGLDEHKAELGRVVRELLAWNGT